MELSVEMLPYIRIIRGLSQSEMSSILGVSQSYYSRIEVGKVAFNETLQQRLWDAIYGLHIDCTELQHIQYLVNKRDKKEI